MHPSTHSVPPLSLERRRQKTTRDRLSGSCDTGLEHAAGRDEVISEPFSTARSCSNQETGVRSGLVRRPTETGDQDMECSHTGCTEQVRTHAFCVMHRNEATHGTKIDSGIKYDNDRN